MLAHHRKRFQANRTIAERGALGAARNDADVFGHDFSVILDA
jgi:hypothetical protein